MLSNVLVDVFVETKILQIIVNLYFMIVPFF